MSVLLNISTVEHGTFTPLVFTIAGGMGPAATTFYKRLASNLSDHLKKPYLHILNYFCCWLSFYLLRSAILCLRGAHSSYRKPIFSNLNLLDQALSEGRMAHWHLPFSFPIFCTLIIILFCEYNGYHHYN